MSSTNITVVSAFFNHVPLRKRKEVKGSYRLATLPDHKLLTPEEFNEYERIFWRYIESVGYKNPPNNARISVSWGNHEGYIESVELRPKQTQLVCR